MTAAEVFKYNQRAKLPTLHFCVEHAGRMWYVLHLCVDACRMWYIHERRFLVWLVPGSVEMAGRLFWLEGASRGYRSDFYSSLEDLPCWNTTRNITRLDKIDDSTPVRGMYSLVLPQSKKGLQGELQEELWLWLVPCVRHTGEC